MEINKNLKTKEDTINTTINLFNFLGWSLALITITLSAILSLFDEDKSQKVLAVSLFVLKFIQTFQISDVFLGLAKTGSVPILSLMQISGRLLTTWGFMHSNNPFILNFLIIFCWSNADAVRTAYYMFKEINLLGLIRYNLFIINYPIGFFSELVLMELYLRKSDSINFFYFIRFIQISFLIGFGFLYVHLLNNRRRFFRKNVSKLK